MLNFLRRTHFRVVPFDRRRAERSPALAAGVAIHMFGEREAFDQGRKLAYVTEEGCARLSSAEDAQIADGAGARLRDGQNSQRWVYSCS